MRSFIILSLVVTSIQLFSQVRVSSYYRKDGTYVQSHYRSNPDGIPYNNWSYPGNKNPYTGIVASGNTSTYLDNYYNIQSSNYSPSTITLPSYSNSTYILQSHYIENYKSPSYSSSTYYTPSVSTPVYTSSKLHLSTISVKSPTSVDYLFSSNSNNINSNSTTARNNNFIVTSGRAYFHSESSSMTVRKAYITKGEIGRTVEQKDGFVYIRFTNTNGQLTKGWISINDISILSEITHTSFKTTFFKVAVSKAYFYSEPFFSSKRKAYLIFGELLYGQKFENNFIYTTFKNASGIVTTGWLQVSDISEND